MPHLTHYNGFSRYTGLQSLSKTMRKNILEEDTIYRQNILMQDNVENCKRSNDSHGSEAENELVIQISIIKEKSKLSFRILSIEDNLTTNRLRIE